MIAIIFFVVRGKAELSVCRRRLRPWTGIAIVLLIAAPWHIIAGIRNRGFLWFYFVNEHVLRFLGRRYPRDYNKLPALAYWLLHLAWLFPWSRRQSQIGSFSLH